MTENDKTAMERIAALEAKVALLEKALRVAFGARWMDIQVSGDDEPPKQL